MSRMEHHERSTRSRAGDQERSITLGQAMDELLVLLGRARHFGWTTSALDALADRLIIVGDPSAAEPLDGPLVVLHPHDVIVREAPPTDEPRTMRAGGLTWVENPSHRPRERRGLRLGPGWVLVASGRDVEGLVR